MWRQFQDTYVLDQAIEKKIHISQNSTCFYFGSDTYCFNQILNHVKYIMKWPTKFDLNPINSLFVNAQKLFH